MGVSASCRPTGRVSRNESGQSDKTRAVNRSPTLDVIDYELKGYSRTGFVSLHCKPAACNEKAVCEMQEMNPTNPTTRPPRPAGAVIEDTPPPTRPPGQHQRTKSMTAPTP